MSMAIFAFFTENPTTTVENENFSETGTFWSAKSCELPNGDCGAECSNGNSDDCWEEKECKSNDDINAILTSAYSPAELEAMATNPTRFYPSVIIQLKAEGTLPIK